MREQKGEAIRRRYCRARVAHAELGIRGEDDTMMRPPQPVRARRMPPVHRPPLQAPWMVLIEAVPLAFVEDAAIRVVEPAPRGGQVNART